MLVAMTTAELDGLLARGRNVGDLLVERGQSVAVAEGAAGGLVSAALLHRPGASAYFLGGSVIYTPAATRAFISGEFPTPEGLRGATETFASYLARSVAVRLGATWGVGEGGAAGPTGNPYGDPAGHAWVAVAGARPGAGPDAAAGQRATPPGPRAASDPEDIAVATRHVLTGDDDRLANMVAFATAALDLLAERIRA